MAKNWRNSGFVAKFLTKFALFDERKVAFLAATSWSLWMDECRAATHDVISSGAWRLTSSANHVT